MRDFFIALFVLLAMLASCSSQEGDVLQEDGDNIEEFEQKAMLTEEKEAAIAEMVGKYDEVADVAVSISGGIAVIGLDLVDGNFCHTDIIAIKQRTVDEIKAEFDDINHVAVTTAPDMFQKLVNPFADIDCHHEEASDLFDIPIVTP